MYQKLCTIRANTRQVNNALTQRVQGGRTFYCLEFDIIMTFGLTELKAQFSWKENVRDLAFYLRFYLLIEPWVIRVVNSGTDFLAIHPSC